MSGFSLLGGWEEFLPAAKKFTHSPPPSRSPTHHHHHHHHQIFIPSPPPKVNLPNITFSCSHCSCTISVLISYSFDTQIMLISI